MRRICFPYFGAGLGGSHRSSLIVIKNIRRHGYEPVVLLRAGEADAFAELLRDEGVEFQTQPPPRLPPGTDRLPRAFRNALTVLSYRKELADFIARNDIALVHSQDVVTHYIWSLPCRAKKVPLLIHWRSNFRKAPPYWLMFDTAARVLCVSEYTIGELPPRFRGKAEVVLNPFDVESYQAFGRGARDELLKEIGLPGDSVLVGLFANLAPRKRQDLFVRIMHRCKEMDPDARVVGLIFGAPEPDMLARVEDLRSRLGVADSVRLMGFRKPGEHWMAACDIVAAPAIEEPYGRAIVEATLLGRPIVAARSGGNAEILDDGKTGLVVEPDDVEAFAQAFLALARDPARRDALGEAARAMAVQRYSAERHVSRVAEVYEDLLSPGASRPI